MKRHENFSKPTAKRTKLNVDVLGVIHSFNRRPETHKAHILCCAVIENVGMTWIEGTWCNPGVTHLTPPKSTDWLLLHEVSADFVMWKKYGVIFPDCAKTIALWELVRFIIKK
jgi:hypothetical protein